MIRFGIVGCGNISASHAEAIRLIKGAELVACCDSNSEKARQFANQQQCLFFTDYQNMLEQGEIDAVIIATPHYLHSEMTIQAFESGKHVLCEKPLAISIEEAKLVLAKRAAYKNLHYVVCYQNRFNPSYMKMKTMIDENHFGKLRGVKCELTWHRDGAYYDAAVWKGTIKEEGGGVLINQAIHSLDAITWMIGCPQKLKGKVMTSLLEDVIEVEDAAMATAVLSENIPLLIYASNNYFHDPSPTITFDFEQAQVVLTTNQLVVNGHVTPLATTENNKAAKDYWGNGHIRLIRAFVNQLEGKEDPCIDFLAGTDALDSLKIVCSIYESDRLNDWVYLNK
jgi:UDP-N-acetyl-2-amino-2-deoxyglucuronate dehydrogenase